jgi:hypothetical protein
MGILACLLFLLAGMSGAAANFDEVMRDIALRECNYYSTWKYPYNRQSGGDDFGRARDSTYAICMLSHGQRP